MTATDKLATDARTAERRRQTLQQITADLLTRAGIEHTIGSRGIVIPESQWGQLRSTLQWALIGKRS